MKFTCAKCRAEHDENFFHVVLRRGRRTRLSACKACVRAAGNAAYRRRVGPPKPRPRRPVADRFWEKVEKSDGCWLWLGAKARMGAGDFAITKRQHTPAHRYSWELHFGPIPDGLLVCHHCDNPPCVRPDHLFLGTHNDNMADMVAKGRHFSPFRGATHCIHGHEFTPENTYQSKEGYRRCRTCRRAEYHRLKVSA